MDLFLSCFVKQLQVFFVVLPVSVKEYMAWWVGV